MIKNNNINTSFQFWRVNFLDYFDGEFNYIVRII